MFCDRPLWTLYRQFLGSNTFQNIMDEHTVGIYNNATVSVAFRLFHRQNDVCPDWNFPPLAYALTFLVPLAFGGHVFGVARVGGVLIAAPRQERVRLCALTADCVAHHSARGGLHARLALGPVLLRNLARLLGQPPDLFLPLPLRRSCLEPSDHGGQLDENTFELHLLHFRYVSLVLFWIAAYVTARRECRASGRLREGTDYRN